MREASATQTLQSHLITNKGRAIVKCLSASSRQVRLGPASEAIKKNCSSGQDAVNQVGPQGLPHIVAVSAAGHGLFLFWESSPRHATAQQTSHDVAPPDMKASRPLSWPELVPKEGINNPAFRALFPGGPKPSLWCSKSSLTDEATLPGDRRRLTGRQGSGCPKAPDGFQVVTGRLIVFRAINARIRFERFELDRADPVALSRPRLASPTRTCALVRGVSI